MAITFSENNPNDHQNTPSGPKKRFVAFSVNAMRQETLFYSSISLRIDYCSFGFARSFL